MTKATVIHTNEKPFQKSMKDIQGQKGIHPTKKNVNSCTLFGAEAGEGVVCLMSHVLAKA